MSRSAAEYAWSARIDVFARTNPGTQIVAYLGGGHRIQGVLVSDNSAGGGSCRIGEWTVQHREIVAWKAVTI